MFMLCRPCCKIPPGLIPEFSGNSAGLTAIFDPDYIAQVPYDTYPPDPPVPYGTSGLRNSLPPFSTVVRTFTFHGSTPRLYEPNSTNQHIIGAVYPTPTTYKIVDFVVDNASSESFNFGSNLNLFLSHPRCHTLYTGTRTRSEASHATRGISSAWNPVTNQIHVVFGVENLTSSNAFDVMHMTYDPTTFAVTGPTLHTDYHQPYGSVVVTANIWGNAVDILNKPYTITTPWGTCSFTTPPGSGAGLWNINVYTLFQPEGYWYGTGGQLGVLESYGRVFQGSTFRGEFWFPLPTITPPHTFTPFQAGGTITLSGPDPISSNDIGADTSSLSAKFGSVSRTIVTPTPWVAGAFRIYGLTITPDGTPLIVGSRAPTTRIPGPFYTWLINTFSPVVMQTIPPTYPASPLSYENSVLIGPGNITSTPPSPQIFLNTCFGITHTADDTWFLIAQTSGSQQLLVRSPGNVTGGNIGTGHRIRIDRPSNIGTPIPHIPFGQYPKTRPI